MRKSLFLVLFLSVLLLSGCDTFRRLAGRPTSGEIEAAREQKLAEKLEQEALKDSLQLIIDSLGTPSEEDSLKEDVKIATVEEKGGLFYTQELEYRYYVILGSFKEERYLNAMIKTVSDAGYIPVVIKFANGFTSVGVAAENSLYEATYALRGLRREEFCPEDVWILYNKK